MFDEYAQKRSFGLNALSSVIWRLGITAWWMQLLLGASQGVTPAESRERQLEALIDEMRVMRLYRIMGSEHPLTLCLISNSSPAEGLDGSTVVAFVSAYNIHSKKINICNDQAN